MTDSDRSDSGFISKSIDEDYINPESSDRRSAIGDDFDEQQHIDRATIDYSEDHVSNEWKDFSDEKVAGDVPQSSTQRTTFNPYESRWKSWTVDRSEGEGVPYDGPTKINYAEWLRRLNDGAYDGKYQGASKSLYDVATFSSILELTDKQTERAKHLRQKHSGRTGHHSNNNTELIALAAITLAANEDQRAIRNEDDFQHVRELCNVTSRQIRNVRKQLHKHL